MLNMLQCWYLFPPAIKGEPVYICKAGQAGTLSQLDSAGSREHLWPVFKTQSQLHAFLPSPICTSKALIIAPNGLSHMTFTVFLSLHNTTCCFNFRWSIMMTCLNVMMNCLKLVIGGLSVPNQKLYNIVSDTRTFYQSLRKSTALPWLGRLTLILAIHLWPMKHSF